MRESRCLLAGGFALLYTLCSPRYLDSERHRYTSPSLRFLSLRLQRSYGRVQDNGRNKGDSAGYSPADGRRSEQRGEMRDR